MARLRATSAEVVPPRVLANVACAVVLACGGGESALPEPTWSTVVESPAAALLSISGTSVDDVWMVGADDGSGPLVLHWDGTNWTRVPTGTNGHLWWVHVFSQGRMLVAGAGGQVLRWDAGAFERVATPGIEGDVVFGVWAPSENEAYATGAAADGTGFLWHDTGAGFAPVALPEAGGSAVPSLFKVWGTAPDDVWLVGERGVVLRGSAAGGFAPVASGVDERLFTVHASGRRVVMVGGSANGVALELGESGLEVITPPGAAPLQGTCVTTSGDVWAVGVGGNAHVRRARADAWGDLVPEKPVQSLHAVWVDPSGAAWMVGGNVLTEQLDAGVSLRYAAGPPIPSFGSGVP